MLNLHIVFTMNPSGDGLKDKCSTSPALFNRCVLNWFGDWSNNALYSVGQEFTIKIDLDKQNVNICSCFRSLFRDREQGFKTHVHQEVYS